MDEGDVSSALSLWSRIGHGRARKGSTTVEQDGQAFPGSIPVGATTLRSDIFAI